MQSKVLQVPKITIIGHSGSGKTCYLVGMYLIMSRGFKGFTLTAKPDQDKHFELLGLKMMDSSKGMERFPSQTDEREVYNLELKFGFKRILDFDWIDYPGGTLSDTSEQNIILMDHINQSACLFICVDGQAFSNKVDDSANYIRKDSHVNILNKYASANNKIPPVVIIITKFDLREKERSECISVIRDVYNPLFVEDNEFQRVVAIIPVFLGKEITAHDHTGKLDPGNIQLPVLFALFQIIKSTIIKRKMELRNINNNITNKKASANIFNKGNKKELDVLNEAYKSKNSEINKLESDLERLNAECFKANFPLYINGEEKKISDMPEIKT